MRLALVVVALLLPGLAGADDVSRRAAAAEMSDLELCGEYGTRLRKSWTVSPAFFRGGYAFGRQFDALVVEIKRRNLIRQDYAPHVVNSIAVPGMTAVEALCAWGRPEDILQVDGKATWLYPKAIPDINQRSLVIANDVVESVSY